MARNRPPWTIQRTRIRRPAEKWEILVGWNAPEEFDETGIDAWVKRKGSKVKQTGKKAAPRQEWEEYGCSIGKYCSAIPDEEVYVAESLKESLRPNSTAKPPIHNVKGAADKEEDTSGDKTKDRTKNPRRDNTEANTLVRAKRLLGLSQTKKKNTTDRGIYIVQDEEEGETELRTITFTSKGRDVPVICRNELDIGVNHLITERQATQDLLPKFTPRDAILKQPPKIHNSSRSDTHSIISSRQVEKQELPPPPEPVKLCYTQSNISLMLQKPVQHIVRTLSREYLYEDSGMNDRDEDDYSSPAPPLDDLVSDAGSWSNESDQQDYPQHFSKHSSREAVNQSTDILDQEGVDDDHDDYHHNNAIDHISSSGKSHTMPGLSIASFKRHDQLVREGSAVNRCPTVIKSLPSSLTDTKRSSPFPLVLNTMVLDDVPNGQGRVSPNEQDRKGARSAKSKSAKSRLLSARTLNSHNSNSPILVHTRQTLDTTRDLPFLAHGKTFTFGLDSYTNPYKERLSSRVMPIGDLLPAVDTSLRSVLTARKHMHSGLEDSKWRLTMDGHGGTKNSEMLGKDMLVPFENHTLSNEGVGMHRMKESPTIVGQPAFKTIANGTSLHLAQENANKRLHSQHALTNGTVLPSEESLLVRLQQSQAGRWQSSNGSLYSAPPRLGYVPRNSKERELKGSFSPGEPIKSPTTNQPTSNSTLNSLFNQSPTATLLQPFLFGLSRRRRIKERPMQTSRSGPTPKINSLPKQESSPVRPHYQELTELRT